MVVTDFIFGVVTAFAAEFIVLFIGIILAGFIKAVNDNRKTKSETK